MRGAGLGLQFLQTFFDVSASFTTNPIEASENIIEAIKKLRPFESMKWPACTKMFFDFFFTAEVGEFAI